MEIHREMVQSKQAGIILLNTAITIHLRACDNSLLTRPLCAIHFNGSCWHRHTHRSAGVGCGFGFSSGYGFDRRLIGTNEFEWKYDCESNMLPISDQICAEFISTKPESLTKSHCPLCPFDSDRFPIQKPFRYFVMKDDTARMVATMLIRRIR